MGSLLFKTLVGCLAGVLAWIIWEPSAPSSYYSPEWEMWSRNYILTLSAFIGASVGAVNGFTKGSRGHAFREGGLGLLFGIIGGGLGLSVASMVEGMTHQSLGLGERVIELTAIGSCVGAGVGAATLSVNGMVQGLIGGTIAGAISGVTFDAVGQALGAMILMAQHKTSGEVGGPSRALLGILLGGLIAMFVGLAELLMRSAWIRLSLGRNEGKEWAIDRAQVLIGRNELANIPLFGDSTVAAQHAYILKHGSEYLVADPGGSPHGVLLNGQRVNQQAKLFHGATIQVGNTVLQFLMKAGRAPAPVVDGRAYAQPGAANPYAGQPMPGQPMPGQPMPSQPMGATMMNPGMPTQSMPSQAMPGPGMQPTMMSPQPGMQAGMQPTMMSPGMAPGMPAGMASAGGLTLVAMDGPLAGQRFPLGAGLELGRTSPMVPMSYDTEASRRHAMVAPTPTGASVQDIGSTNGTFVNNQRVQNIEARPGDLIRVGRTTFRLES
jgi:pSer/pThr/pTyr-binding forkhead associated (FHA) protein